MRKVAISGEYFFKHETNKLVAGVIIAVMIDAVARGRLALG
jgi:hypothetical protein